MYSNEYKDAKAELEWLREFYTNVDIQIKKFEDTFKKVTDEDEVCMLSEELDDIVG